MIILKLIAWNDRPEDRYNDLKDILLIIKEYFDINSNEIFDEHFDTFPEEFDKIMVAARVLGEKQRKLSASPKK